jgi:RimJ/RimL family protein N-acetyltransferase
MIHIPTITTSRIVLRAYGEGEVARLHEILQVSDVLRYFPTSDPPSLAKVQRLVESQEQHWEENGFGWCGLNVLPETDEVELKYLLAKDFWGRGLATEASRASMNYALTDTTLDTIIGLVHPENIASQRVLEKVGMSFLDHKEYFGMDCLRYMIHRERMEEKFFDETGSMDGYDR